ncbi:MAG: hypothetical protein NXH78_04030 [Hyphomonadaceae bacterium]|nr:hypothetical protein [Hyphomonadaceae bacterium]
MSIDLIEFQDLQRILREQNASLEQIAIRSGEQPVSSGTFASTGWSAVFVEELEDKLRCEFPSTFLSAVQQYCFDALQIGQTEFVKGSDGKFHSGLQKRNVHEPWWDDRPIGWGLIDPPPELPARPNGWLFIANGDPYWLLLNLDDGSIYCWDHEEQWSDAKYLARSILQYVQCHASLWLHKELGVDVSLMLAEVISQTRGDEEFWEYEALA